jgi:DNA-dependent RNA polymerase auxiliary subunit epsilon
MAIFPLAAFILSLDCLVETGKQRVKVIRKDKVTQSLFKQPNNLKTLKLKQPLIGKSQAEQVPPIELKNEATVDTLKIEEEAKQTVRDLVADPNFNMELDDMIRDGIVNSEQSQPELELKDSEIL